MQLRNKVLLSSTAAVLLLGTAVAVPLVAINANMQDLVVQGQESNKQWSEMTLASTSDPKFNAIADKLTYSANDKYVSMSDAFTETLPTGFVGDIYKSLPAVKSVIINLEESDAMQKERIANNTVGRIQALQEAQTTCKVTSLDPTVNTLTDAEKEKFFATKNLIKNLPAYVEYCETKSAS